MFVAFELFDSLTEMGQLPAGIADHHLAWIQTLYWLGAGGGILYFLYLKRKLLASWGLLLVAGFFALILTPKGGEGGMFGSFVSYSNEGVVTLEEVEISGSMQMNGVNYLELIGVFSIEDVAEDVDLWTSIHGCHAQWRRNRTAPTRGEPAHGQEVGYTLRGPAGLRSRG